MSRNNLVVEREKLQFTMSRIFDAPRELVWKVTTDPALIPEWWGPQKYATVVDQMDFRVGGKWRYVQTDEQGNIHAFNGVYQEILPPERLAYTFEYEPMAGHISTDHVEYQDLPGGETRITTTTTFTSLEDLEGMLQADMESGAVQTWDRLEELVKTKLAMRS